MILGAYGGTIRGLPAPHIEIIAHKAELRTKRMSRGAAARTTLDAFIRGPLIEGMLWSWLTDQDSVKFIAVP